MSDSAPRTRVRPAALDLALSSAMIGAGGILLGVQFDGANRLHGTGYSAFAIGVIVALVASYFSARRGGIPHDGVAAWSVVAQFFGIAFAVGGVIVPGGPWTIVEFAVLIWLFAFRSARGPFAVTQGAVIALGAMLILRFWITYQASRGHFEVATVDVPILSWLPTGFLEPLRHIFIGTFTPDELELPPSDGLEFARTCGLWSVGFAQVVGGLVWRSHAALEHEDDRIHALIQTLPRELARIVETLLPEREWRELGLHGLSERKLEKRIEELVRERIGRARDVEASLRTLTRGELGPGGFAAELRTAIEARDERREER